MVASVTSFEATFQLPVSPRTESVQFVTNVGGNVVVDLNWSINFPPMDVTSTPDLTKYVMTIDGTPRTITLIGWQDAQTSRFTCASPPATVAVQIRLAANDVATRNIGGSFARAPQVELQVF